MHANATRYSRSERPLTPPEPGAGHHALETKTARLSLLRRGVLFEFANLNFQAQVVDAVSIDESLVQADKAFAIEVEDRRVERLAAFVRALLHRFFEGIDFAFFDEVFNARRVHQDFHGADAKAVCSHHQALRDNRAQIERQL